MKSIACDIYDKVQSIITYVDVMHILKNDKWNHWNVRHIRVLKDKLFEEAVNMRIESQ
jgi:hypothetical protein